MNDDAQAGILFGLGALAVRLGVTDAHLTYIRPAMGPFLALAGVVLLVLGSMVLLRPGRTPVHADHGHGSASGITWLLVAPIIAIAVVVPHPLGAFAANRSAATHLTLTKADLGPLPKPAAPGEPVDLTLKEFIGRAVYGQGTSLRGAPVRLLGFVAPDPRGGGFYLTRFIVTCCAADARPIRVAIHGLTPPWPATDSWAEVTGTWHPEARDPEDQRPPILDANELQTVTAPASPYLR
jgi:uncharacterized repeat protein (TIGR03943 family)